jgi:tRNA 5-methylaminomethyl-2-thiouridine biosynthesis bifunctional protein
MPEHCADRTPLIPAQLYWQDNTPYSEGFQDIYFSRQNGLAETQHVFLQGNRIPSRWRELPPDTSFVIVETGFGTGLNFLATWQQWRSLGPQAPRLSFVSVERHPLTRADLRRCLALWPELDTLSSQLLALYPPAVAGNHLLLFEQGRVRLNLIFGDVLADLKRYPFSADCWYLDGFAPGRNPEMWQPELFALMRQRSKPGATLATFTSAGLVRRGLLAQGFSVDKVKGFGRKREMLQGRLDRPAPGAHSYLPDSLPHWCRTSTTSERPLRSDSEPPVLVIGAGLSGLLTAHALALRGRRVELIDQCPTPMGGASGQQQLALYAKLPVQLNREARILAQQLICSQSYFTALQTLYPDFEFWHPSGLLQLAWNDQERRRLDTLLQRNLYPPELVRRVERQEAERLCGLRLTSEGLWYPDSGWLAPQLLAQALLTHPNLRFQGNLAIEAIERLDNEGLWCVHTRQHPLTHRTIILATAHQTTQIRGLAPLPLKRLRGQVTTLRSRTLEPSQCVICGEGYLCPPIADEHHFGATYDPRTDDATVRAEDNQDNMESIRRWLPDWLPSSDSLSAVPVTGSAGVRCTSPDYLPLAGAYPDIERMQARLTPWRHNAHACGEQTGDYLEGVYLIAGHGSKGLVSIPGCAEWLAAQICGEPAAMSDEFIAALNPARFLIRGLIRNLPQGSAVSLRPSTEKGDTR